MMGPLIGCAFVFNHLVEIISYFSGNVANNIIDVNILPMNCVSPVDMVGSQHCRVSCHGDILTAYKTW